MYFGSSYDRVAQFLNMSKSSVFYWVHFSKNGTRLLLEIFAARYETISISVSTNLFFLTNGDLEMAILPELDLKT